MSRPATSTGLFPPSLAHLRETVKRIRPGCTEAGSDHSVFAHLREGHFEGVDDLVRVFVGVDGRHEDDVHVGRVHAVVAHIVAEHLAAHQVV